MELNAKNITVGSVVGSLTLVFGALKVFGLGWADVGWKSPASHEADIAAVRAELARIEQESTGATQEFYLNWRCDEAQEELIELLKAQRAGDDSVETAERIKTLRKRIENLECDKFDD